MDKLDTMAEAVAGALRAVVARSLEPWTKRVEAVEARQPEKGEPGQRGEKGDPGHGIQGKDGRDGLPGKDADPEFIRSEVVLAVKATPLPKDGQDGKDAPPVDVDAIVKTVLAQVPEPVPGRDGRDGVVGQKGDDGRNGADGQDGLGLDDLELSLADDGRTLSFKFVRGDFVKEKAVRLHTMIYRGIWRAGTYERGDTATYGGSLWHCEKERTTDKPGDATGAWKLCAKRGNDGRDAPAPTE